VDVEKGDRKGADAAAGAAEAARYLTEQRRSCPLKPLVGFAIQRSRCHGDLFLFEGEVDDEIALG
jgi:hypothetical protein